MLVLHLCFASFDYTVSVLHYHHEFDSAVLWVF